MLNAPINTPLFKQCIMGKLKSHCLPSFSTQALNICSLKLNSILQKIKSKLSLLNENVRKKYK